ncbi:Sperm-associated antigen 1 [Clarias magur]|uniref:Sperm-associated antigen 1 n=1 Tax=Clarias magur TaxID=1594786 RepID=A0A8J4T987_CLAMG|nr:Sperm-associated antigen 1 [Clarias magur]
MGHGQENNYNGVSNGAWPGKWVKEGEEASPRKQVHEMRAMTAFSGSSGRQCELAVRWRRALFLLQQDTGLGMRNAIMVAAKADVILLELDGPEWRVELAIAVLAVRVHSTHKAHEQYQQNDDYSQDDDVELRP